MRPCPYCRSQIDDRAVRCPNCGKSVVERSGMTPEAMRAIIILAVLLGILLAYGIATDKL